jgi:hypothetical protein
VARGVQQALIAPARSIASTTIERLIAMRARGLAAQVARQELRQMVRTAIMQVVRNNPTRACALAKVLPVAISMIPEVAAVLIPSGTMGVAGSVLNPIARGAGGTLEVTIVDQGLRTEATGIFRAVASGLCRGL